MVMKKSKEGVSGHVTHKKILRTWIEIDTKAIAKNYHSFRKLLGKKTMLMSVVKSNAYGHNIIEFAKEYEKLGVDWLGVDSLVEGMALRREGIKTSTLVLGFTLPALLDEARKNNISVTVSSFAQLEEVLKLKKTKKILKIHIKVDTGMHRQGFQLDEANRLLHDIALAPIGIFIIEGLYTHFAEAKNPRSGDATRRQIVEYEKWIALFYEAGHNLITHAAATGGAMLYPKAHYDMVRIGIGSYGLWPSIEALHHLSSKIKLHPVLTWKAVVGEVKHVKKGERVGYDLTEILFHDSILAIIPVGYWHGIPRLLSSKGRVLLGGETARIVGRVSMDMIIVDVTNIKNILMGDEVVLIGRQGKEEITASEIAQFGATTQYEIVTRLNPLIRRFYN